MTTDKYQMKNDTIVLLIDRPDPSRGEKRQIMNAFNRAEDESVAEFVKRVENMAREMVVNGPVFLMQPIKMFKLPVEVENL